MKTEPNLEEIKEIMDVTTVELVKKMETVKFRKKVFKNCGLFQKHEINQAIKDWDTLKQETKIDWFESVLFKTKDKDGKQNNKTYEEILMIVNLLKVNKINVRQTWRDIKNYGEIKKIKNDTK